MNPSSAPRGLPACLESLEKRRKWVQRRAGGTYDVRESIALGYAIGLLRSAKELGVDDLLESHALKQGRILPEWTERGRIGPSMPPMTDEVPRDWK